MLRKHGHKDFFRHPKTDPEDHLVSENGVPHFNSNELPLENLEMIWNDTGYTLWLCQNSYWKWPFIVDFPIKNGDFQ